MQTFQGVIVLDEPFLAAYADTGSVLYAALRTTVVNGVSDVFVDFVVAVYIVDDVTTVNQIIKLVKI